MCRTFQFQSPSDPSQSTVVRLNKSKPLLPVEYRGREAWFPWEGFCQTEELKKGAWQELKPMLVKVQVNRGQSNGVWFVIRQGVYALLLSNRERGQGLYILTQSSTHYYRTMTGAKRMPVLINQVI